MNARRKQIMDAAHQLFIDKGFADTSIQEILDEAGVAKGTFYNYFASKTQCLVAILEYVKEEGNKKRAELAYGKSPTDEDIFVEQIAVRLKMNRQYKLIGLFQAASISLDKELQAYIKKQHGQELTWMSHRIVEVYELEDKRFSFDYAVLLAGMTHHLIYIWMMGADKEVQVEKVIKYALSQLRFIIDGDNSSSTPFFSQDWLSVYHLDGISMVQVKEELIELLSDTIKKMQKSELVSPLEHLEFLKGELETEQPRYFLIESVLLALSKYKEAFGMEQEIKRIGVLTWKWLQTVKEA
ncbi:TetR/AcrR family transcriptional regulator [Radiobacillus deserti]|uniref:TetR/AcrR family transcriptional regulator n=1 Tax=Radiobacillus deserti TaxID=2594883 RepID=A0A516KKG8_9BACI|nr:TetR/AcrR family transcriptional regulator [Radiobacillus deserti]QDP41882.1 TetR/AcrR family transcriptional regulator [Radiobacillus deserti]